MTTDITLRVAELADLKPIVEIYNEGVEDGIATCDLSGFTPQERVGWFREHQEPYRIWVAEEGDRILGWTAVSRYDRKPCFHRTGIIATYVARAARGRGVGSALRRHLICECSRLGFHTIVSRIWAPNDVSVNLAEKYGFERVGYMKELVSKDGGYIDCIFYQLML